MVSSFYKVYPRRRSRTHLPYSSVTSSGFRSTRVGSGRLGVDWTSKHLFLLTTTTFDGSKVQQRGIFDCLYDRDSELMK